MGARAELGAGMAFPELDLTDSRLERVTLPFEDAAGSAAAPTAGGAEELRARPRRQAAVAATRALSSVLTESEEDGSSSRSSSYDDSDDESCSAKRRRVTGGAGSASGARSSRSGARRTGKRESRKQRNRESAARSRLRQREYLTTLESRVTELERMNAQAQARVRQLEAENASLRSGGKGGIATQPASAGIFPPAAGTPSPPPPSVAAAATPIDGEVSVPGPSAAVAATLPSLPTLARSRGTSVEASGSAHSRRSDEAVLLSSLIDFISDDFSAVAPPPPSVATAAPGKAAADRGTSENNAYLYLRKPAVLATAGVRTGLIAKSILIASISLLQRGETTHCSRISRGTRPPCSPTSEAALEEPISGDAWSLGLQQTMAAMSAEDRVKTLVCVAAVRRLARAKGAARTASALLAAATIARRRAEQSARRWGTEMCPAGGEPAL